MRREDISADRDGGLQLDGGRPASRWLQRQYAQALERMERLEALVADPEAVVPAQEARVHQAEAEWLAVRVGRLEREVLAFGTLHEQHVAEEQRLRALFIASGADEGEQRAAAKLVGELDRLQVENAELRVRLSRLEPVDAILRRVDGLEQERDRALAEVARLQQRVADLGGGAAVELVEDLRARVDQERQRAKLEARFARALRMQRDEAWQERDEARAWVRRAWERSGRQSELAMEFPWLLEDEASVAARVDALREGLDLEAEFTAAGQSWTETGPDGGAVLRHPALEHDEAWLRQAAAEPEQRWLRRGAPSNERNAEDIELVLGQLSRLRQAADEGPQDPASDEDGPSHGRADGGSDGQDLA